MANLKDLIVNGVARIVGKVYSNGGFVGNLEGTADVAKKIPVNPSTTPTETGSIWIGP